MDPKAKSAGQIKHLEMLQAVIARMANNSFLIKGCCITLVSALLALAAKDVKGMVFVTYLPVLSSGGWMRFSCAKNTSSANSSTACKKPTSWRQSFRWTQDQWRNCLLRQSGIVANAAMVFWIAVHCDHFDDAAVETLATQKR